MKARLRRHRHRPQQSVITSFCYPVEKAEILDKAADLAVRDDLSFSEWLLALIEEKVQQEKNAIGATDNPLNITYVQRPIKTLDDILHGLVTLDDFMETNATPDELERIEGRTLALAHKAKSKWSEAIKREMFKR